MEINWYYLDDGMIEHQCCYDQAVVRKCEPGQGMYGGDVDLVCECRGEYAQLICDALNAKLRQEEQP